MILSFQSIRLRNTSIDGRPLLVPMIERSVHGPTGMTYGLGPCGYDIRIKRAARLRPGLVELVSSIERFDMPDDLMGHVADKSSLARRGVFVQNTVIDPGWRGYLTLEVTYHGAMPVFDLMAGQPIAQIVFHKLDQPTVRPYTGKYQDQPAHPVGMIHESGSEPRGVDGRQAGQGSEQ